VLLGLRPNQRLRPTRAGRGYFAVWIALLIIGLYQQSNLVLLVAGFAAGPMVASVLVSAAMLRRLEITRRSPKYIFSGDPLVLDYMLANGRPWAASLALVVEDDLSPADRTVPGAGRVTPRVVFTRVPGRARGRLRWQGPSPHRGRYSFSTIDLETRSPFGLLERRLTTAAPGEIVVYPKVGQLARRWHQLRREASETKRGLRHDRTVQQQEYHGLRDYRPGDSPRWIHWRTTARLGQPMVKEFEQQNEQDLVVLIDPWLPRSKVTPEQRERLEEAIRFAATVCLDTCRRLGHRLILGWTGPTPGVRQGPASVKLLHELLEQLAVMRASPEGQLSSLLDALPPAALRDAMVVVVSTRPINLFEEAERSARLAGSAGRSLMNRAMLLDASRGDLDELVQYGGRSIAALPWRESSESGSQSRLAAFADSGLSNGPLSGLRSSVYRDGSSASSRVD
jgi:uncharacterized protein (DUF58 family)